VKQRTNWRADGGSAIVDLVGFGILFQIPILMFATLAIKTQQQSFAVEAIARHGLRSHVLAPDRASTDLVITELAKDFGIDPDKLKWNLLCSPAADCLDPETIIRIEVKLGGLVAYSTQVL
jgi:hypothetical protein